MDPFAEFHSLVVDAGHTRVKLAHCCQTSESPLPQPRHSQAAIYGTPVNWDEVCSWFRVGPPQAVLVTGTNLHRAQELIAHWPAMLPVPILLSDKSLIPLAVDVDIPGKVGIDRLLNAVAANCLRGPGTPAIVVDTGTAITVDVVDADGVFRGGAILPGILMGAKSLHEETTTLPHIDVWELLKQEPPVLGRNTEAAIASGLYWGHLGAVKELMARYADWLSGGDQTPLRLLTGGASGILAPYLSGSQRYPELSLQGLALVARHVQLHG